ncbi:tetratricopeptide repeat protein (macronuclear) [Tetrahymena thermophila SB210]|uniref:Tetratricopeptide repeat protein n=1 Tax=Tetrahymena thermophila (strain SB210) TaxID=312017 RepID=Q231B7_TETTS|nr:tetratricopeptide repeat protein [Tetrahymena thermophila SB210]EAR91122.2 tetratricopeptide repeat protein [Tetrahymena thermophila SB210]|eukprot:XP_001011367.2 tetratricopeptide repeat protein [Tetrahymena thermophila SB210]
MSFNFFRELDILNEKKMIGPETFNEFASKKVEKFIKEPQNQHLSGQAFFTFCINLDEERYFLVVKPEFLESTKAKENYINSYKTYLNLKGDNCLVDFEEKYCCFKYNFFRLSQFGIPLEVYIQSQKISQTFLLRLALLLLKSIRKCHEKAYFVEHINLQTVYIDIRNQNILLINPIQKILLEQEQLINMRNSQVNQHKNIQKQTLKKTVLDLINKDSKDFIKTFLNVIGIKSLHFQEMLECNILSSFFKRNFSGKITDSMQYLLIYLYTLKQQKQQADLLQIEFMLINILYQDVKSSQQKQIRQYLQNAPIKQNHDNKQVLISSKSAQKLDNHKLNESHSLQNMSSSKQQNNFSSSNSFLQDNKQNLHSISKIQQTDIQCSSSSQHCLTQQKRNLKKSNQNLLNNQISPKQINQSTKSQQKPNNQSKIRLSNDQNFKEQITANQQQKTKQEQRHVDQQQHNQSANKSSFQIQFEQEQILSNTFNQSQFSSCLKDQTNWLNSIYKIDMSQDQAYFYWRKLEKIKEKSLQQWILTAWILFKYFKFFKEPLDIIQNKVLKLKGNNCSQNYKAQNQEEEEINSVEIKSQSYSLIGIIYWKWKKYHQAVQAFNTALKIDSRNQYALYYLGKNSFLFESNFVKGNNFLLQLLQVNPYNQDLIKKVCKFRQIYQPNDYYWYFLAIIAQPKCHKIVLKLAQQCYDMGDYKLALFFCAKGIELNKNEKDFYFILACIFLVQNNIKQGLKFMIKAQNSHNKQTSGHLVDHYIDVDQEEAEIHFYKDLNSIKFLKDAENECTNRLYN